MIKIVKREPSTYWRAVKIKGQWHQIKELIHIGEKCWSQLFSIVLDNGQHLPRWYFNRLECIEGNEIVGFKVYKPGILA